MPIFRDAFAGETRSRRHLPRVGGSGTAADVNVTPERSLQVATVYSAVRQISEDSSTLPLGEFVKQGNGRVEHQSDPAYRLLGEQPNPDIDAGEFWRTILGWMLLRGNAHAYIERNGAGRVLGLWPIAPTSVEARRVTDPAANLADNRRGSLVYKVTLGTAEFAPISEKDNLVSAENMLHFRAFGLGLEGLSPIGMARQQVGISFAATSYIGGFFARDASPGGTISVSGQLTDTQFERLTAQWKDLHEGFDKSHSLAVLEGGATWESVGLNPVDAAFLDVYKLSRSEIASIYGIPAHKVGDLDHATFANIEQLSIEYVVYCLRNWLVRLEKVSKRILDDPNAYIRFNVDGLLRGDTAARYQAYALARQWGWDSVNDVRRKENQDSIPGGDEYLVPLNMVPAGATPVARANRDALHLPVWHPRIIGHRDAESPVDAHPHYVERVHRVVVDFLAGARKDALRGERADVNDPWVLALAAKLGVPFATIAAEFGSDVAKQLGGQFDPSLIINFISAAAQRSASDIVTTLRDALASALASLDDGETRQDAIDGVFDERVQRAPLVAAGLVVSIGSFGRHEGARQAGASNKRWESGPHARPTHAAMNGETVPMSENFSNGCKWPGDPAGGADEVAGCNCGVSFDV